VAVVASLAVLLAVVAAGLGLWALRLRSDCAALRRDRVPRAEHEALRATLGALLEAVPVPVLLLDADGAVRGSNVAARAAWPGVERGTRPGTLLRGLDEAVAEAHDDLHVDGRELVADDPDHRTFEAYVRSTADGPDRLAVVVALDVTAPVDFRESRRLFSAAVSHELRTPLARLLGLAETLALPLSEEEREALVAQTETEIDNMRRLIDEMLLLAALDRGETAPSEGGSDAGAVIQEVVEDRLARPAGRGHGLTVEADDGLVVPMPSRLLSVVVGNLVDNALRHGGPHAAVHVRVTTVDRYVEISVADTGVGIAAEHLPHVFERFYRGDSSRAGPGTGLGLAVVKHIVEAHGGRAVVESRAGHGTTVRLTLPRRHEGGDPGGPPLGAASSTGARWRRRSGGSGPRIDRQPCSRPRVGAVPPGTGRTLPG
jgi:signal transduction histidine kinase